MITEEICTYEVAKLAKEKGFNKEVFAYYDCEGDLAYVVSPYRGSSIIEILVDKNKQNPIGAEYTSAPTQTLLQKWLREEKGYAISVTAYPTLAAMGKVCYAWEIKSSSDGHYMKAIDGERTFSTYEQALEDALKYSLENLI